MDDRDELLVSLEQEITALLAENEALRSENVVLLTRVKHLEEFGGHCCGLES